MRKRAALMVLIGIAVVLLAGFYAGRALVPVLLGSSVGASVPSGSTRNPDTGSASENPKSPETETPTSSSSGATSPDPSGSGAPGKPDKDTYWIDVDVTNQRVYIMQGEEVVRTMIASTGVEGKETPLGTFEIQNRGEWFFNEKYQQGAMWWVSFKDWGIYLFHSLAMDKDRQVIPEEAEKLGQPASHGCVRLAIEDAKWIYDNIPQRTRVIIHE